jgi:hypothetical protein
MAFVPHFVTNTGVDTWANSTTYTTPCSLTTAIENATAGDMVWILIGDYPRSGSDTFSGAGTVGSPIYWRGCSTFNTGSPTPSIYTRTNGTGDLITSTMPIISYDSTNRKLGTETYNIFDSIVFTGNRSGYLLSAFGTGCAILNCSVTNSANNSLAGCVAFGTYSFVYNSDFKNSNTTQSLYVFSSPSGCKIFNCRFTNLSATCSGCIRIAGSRVLISRCQILASTGVGIAAGTELTTIDSCTIYSQNVSAITTPNSAMPVPISVTNCNLTDNAIVLLNLYNATDSHAVFWYNNRTRDNVSSDIGFGDWPYFNALTTDNGNYTTDYVDATTGDFRPAAASIFRNAATFGGEIGACQRVENYPDAINLLDSSACDGGAVVGTYHPPDVGEVTSNAVFGPSSSLTGTYHRPETNEVIDTASFGIISGQTGTIHQPEAAEVIDTANFGSGSIITGTVLLPNQSEVISTAVYGPSSVTPGTYHEATAAEVQKNIVFGPSSGYTGLYDPITGNYTDPGKANVIKTNNYIFDGVSQVAEFDESARNTDPTEEKVEIGTSYKIANIIKNGSYPTTATSMASQLVTDKSEVTSKVNHIENTQTILTIAGTLDLAAAEAAAAAAQLIVDKAEVNTYKSSILNTTTILTIPGTFDESARNTDPGESNVLIGNNYKIQNISKTASFNESTRNTDPGEDHVENGVTYKILNIGKEGNLLIDGTPDYPLEDDVRSGISFSIYEGKLDLPAVSDVRKNIKFDQETKIGLAYIPVAINVLKNVSVDQTFGLFDEAARNTDPGVENVKFGEEYIIADVHLDGELVGGSGGGNIFGGYIVK